MWRWDLLGEYDRLHGVWCLGGTSMQMKMCAQPERWVSWECWDPCCLRFGSWMASQTLSQSPSYTLWIALPGPLHWENWLVSLPRVRSSPPGWYWAVMHRWQPWVWTWEDRRWLCGKSSVGGWTEACLPDVGQFPIRLQWIYLLSPWHDWRHPKCGHADPRWPPDSLWQVVSSYLGSLECGKTEQYWFVTGWFHPSIKCLLCVCPGNCLATLAYPFCG